MTRETIRIARAVRPGVDMIFVPEMNAWRPVIAAEWDQYPFIFALRIKVYGGAENVKYYAPTMPIPVRPVAA